MSEQGNETAEAVRYAPEGEFLSSAEVSSWTGIARGTLRHWRNRETPIGPPSAKFGRNTVYRRADVQAWIDAQFEQAG